MTKNSRMKEKLKYLINLLDDPDAEVQSEVLREFLSYGLHLEYDIQEFSDIITKEQEKFLTPILLENRKTWFLNRMKELKTVKDEYEKLEAFMESLAKYQLGFRINNILEESLDDLAAQFQMIYPFGNEIDLSLFLFQQLGFEGDKENYYNPLNSNLVSLFETNKGLPITLVILYILTGKRLGFSISGCNFPGHFMAKFYMEEEVVIVDCFNSGKLFFEYDLISYLHERNLSFIDTIDFPVSTDLIIKRILANLSNAYAGTDENNLSLFFNSLLKKKSWQQ
ncbi:MAG: hypothetical protein GXO87_05700 [Chlorobi bacterium]|nr:hypothetical protein [Chlorobiota bacterium]